MEQVVKYFESTSNCKAFTKFCQEEEIDGDSLFRLSKDLLIKYKIKAGLAVKVMRHVEELKSRTSTEHLGRLIVLVLKLSNVKSYFLTNWEISSFLFKNGENTQIVPYTCMASLLAILWGN